MTEKRGQVWVVAERNVEVLEDVDGARSGDDTGGGFGARMSSGVMRRFAVNVDDLRTQMANLLGLVGGIFDQAQTQTGLQLQEVELSVEINTEGQVSIVGTGGRVGGRGGIKLSFKREQASATSNATEPPV